MRLTPVALNSGIAASFVVGSGLFAIGSVPAYIHAVDATADAATYAVGSLFFTAAAFAQLVQAQDPALVDVTSTTQHQARRAPTWAWRPGDRGWAAAACQFPGTLLFNVSTFAALAHNLTVHQEDRLVWRPDIYGSVLFLAASAFGLLAVGRIRDLRPRSAAWWTAWLNMAGSVAFMLSAIASYVLPSTGDLIDIPVAIGGTLVGALCFLLGAALLFPAWRQSLAALTSTPGSTTPVADPQPDPREGRP